MKTVFYNPLQTEYKSPRGAVAVGEELRLMIKFTRPANPDVVEVVVTKDGEKEVPYTMIQKDAQDGVFEYQTSIKITSPGLYHYYFNVHGDETTYYVGSDNNLDALLGKGNKWQLTVFEPIYAEPEWLKGGVMYQIMPDRFCDGGDRLTTKRGVIYRDDWGGTPEYRPTSEGKILNNDFFGGNIKGIIKKLGYLKTLGVTCIYLNPIFEAHSNHKYDTGNYLAIDSDFGSEDDLKTLIKRADKRGMRVVLDGVFSHTGDDSIYFNKYNKYDSEGAYQSQSSPYSDWYDFKKFPDKYKSWWGIDTLPQIDKTNKRYIEFVCGVEGVLAKWGKLGIGGWRLDVADELPDAFLDAATRRIKSITPDALVLGEVWEDGSNKIAYGYRRRYLGGKQLDSVSNYPFKEDILNFAATGDGVRLANTVGHIVNNYPKRVLDSLMNILGTHDTARVLTVLSTADRDISTRDGRAAALASDLDKAMAKVRLAAALQYMLPGVPCLYYGDEAGLEGYEDPFNRRCYPWETPESKWDKRNKKLLSWYKLLGKIRAANSDILAKGEYKHVESGDGVFVFERESYGDKITVIANATDKPLDYAIAGGPIDLITKKPYTNIVPAYGVAIVRKH